MSPDALIEELRGLTAISEQPDKLIASGPFDQGKFERWCAVGAQIAPFGMSVTLTDTSGGALDSSYFDGGVSVVARIAITKPSQPGVMYFLTARALSAFITEGAWSDDLKTVYTAEQGTEFASLATRYRPWRDVTSGVVPIVEVPSADPRRYVRHLTAKQVVPASIAPWLVGTPPGDRTDQIWIAWRSHAARVVAFSLASEIEEASGVVTLIFKSGRPTRVTLDALGTGREAEPSFDASDALARWVFVDGRDVETRHILMSSALAQEWTDGITWSTGIGQFGPLALEAAKSGYELNLSDTGKEALKALTDLRKSLYDEVPKTLQQSRDLASGLWRDFAIGVAAVLARASLPNSSSATTTTVYTIALYAVAAYVLLSGVANILINQRFRAIEASSRSKWLTRVYKYLGTVERSSLAEEPYRAANTEYCRTAWGVGFLYIAFVVVLLFVAQTLSRTSPQGGGTSTQAGSATVSSSPKAAPVSSSTAPRRHP